MEVKFVKPNQQLVEAIAMDMRQADIDEIWASNHHTPVSGLMESWQISDYTSILMINGKPCVMLGLVVLNMLSGIGVPWALASNQMMKHKSQFMKLGPGVVDEMLDYCPTLVNYVHAKNKRSVQWLKGIGFKFDDAKPYGIEKELFHRFYLERK